MALYVPQARRRRRVLAIAAGAAVLGLAVGGVVGRVSAPTVDDRVSEVRQEAKDIAASLGVVSTHIEDTTVGAGGTDLVLQRTGEKLESNFSRAPWLSGSQEQVLRDTLTALKAEPHKDTKEFGARLDTFAAMVEDIFNGRPVNGPSAAPTPSPSPSNEPSPSPEPSGSPSAEPSASAESTASATPTS